MASEPGPRHDDHRSRVASGDARQSRQLCFRRLAGRHDLSGHVCARRQRPAGDQPLRNLRFDRERRGGHLRPDGRQQRRLQHHRLDLGDDDGRDVGAFRLAAVADAGDLFDDGWRSRGRNPDRRADQRNRRPNRQLHGQHQPDRGVGNPDHGGEYLVVRSARQSLCRDPLLLRRDAELFGPVAWPGRDAHASPPQRHLDPDRNPHQHARVAEREHMGRRTRQYRNALGRVPAGFRAAIRRPQRWPRWPKRRPIIGPSTPSMELPPIRSTGSTIQAYGAIPAMRPLPAISTARAGPAAALRRSTSQARCSGSLALPTGTATGFLAAPGLPPSSTPASVNPASISLTASSSATYTVTFPTGVTSINARLVRVARSILGWAIQARCAARERLRQRLHHEFGRQRRLRRESLPECHQYPNRRKHARRDFHRNL